MHSGYSQLLQDYLQTSWGCFGTVWGCLGPAWVLPGVCLRLARAHGVTLGLAWGVPEAALGWLGAILVLLERILAPLGADLMLS